MVNENNTRIQVTVTKKMASWIKQKSKKLGMQPSAFINWLISKNITLLVTKQRPENNEKIKELTNDVSDEEWNKTIEAIEEPEKSSNEEEDDLPF